MGYYCEHCGSQILYPQEDGRIFCSSDYEPSFPGYCHSCLLEHCLNTNCLQCDLKTYPTCTFLPIKKIYLEDCE